MGLIHETGAQLISVKIILNYYYCASQCNAEMYIRMNLIDFHRKLCCSCFMNEINTHTHTHTYMNDLMCYKGYDNRAGL